MKKFDSYKIHPRDVANKSSKEVLYKAIEMALNVESTAVRHNTQTFNSNRYTAIKKIDDYEELKNYAREIKENSGVRSRNSVKQKRGKGTKKNQIQIMHIV